MNKKEENIITIKRRIKTNDKELIRYLEDNMWYARKVYNDAVERYLSHFNEKCKALDNHDDLSLYNFDFMKESTKYMHEVHTKNFNNKYYAVGIIANSFIERLRLTDKMIWGTKFGTFKGKNKNANIRPHFKKYNQFEGSFKVENKRSIVNNKEYSSVEIKDKDSILIKFNRHIHHNIHIKEPLFDFNDNKYFYDKNKRYKFKQKWIKQYGFVKENNKYYIILVMKVEFLSKEHYLDNSHLRMRHAGIDLGIRNPISIYNGINGEQFKVISIMVLNKINRLIERTKKLQNIMDRKQYNSRNYRKVQLKFRKTWERITNIRKWHRWNVAVNIAKSYHMIIVDTFNQHDNSDKTNVNNMNTMNREQGMYLFNEILKYVCKKYSCVYVPAPSDTTRTCSCCGYINEHLPLGVNNLECKKCGEIIDRDKNAAINCYNFGC